MRLTTKITSSQNGRLFIIGLFSLFAFFLARTNATFAATYTVTTTNENGVGSLNQAITDANANAGADQIDFNIPGGGLQTITYTGVMTRPTEQVTINGLSQPGSVCNGSSTELMIEINEGHVGNNFYIPPEAAGTEINGLAITHGPTNNYALFVHADDTVLRCNFFGTTDGTTPDTSETGINRLEIYDADNVTVGGDDVTDMNVFLNNGWYSVSNSSNTARSATIKNNHIGVSLDGTTMVDSIGGGISFGGPSTSVDIADNLISTSTGYSIYFGSGSGGADNVSIIDNLIGVDSTGNTAFSGTGTGLRYTSAGDGLNVSGNVIAAESHGNSAVFISDASPSVDNITVQNNYLNVSQDGTSEFASSGGTNNGLLSYVPGENWLIDSNVVYGESLGIYTVSSSSLANVAITDNIVGMDSTASSCFSGMGQGIGAYGASGTDIMIGGTDPANANTVCADGSSRGIYIGSGTAGMQIASLGNTVVSTNGPSLYQDPTIDINPPTVTGVAANGSDTDITFTADVPAGDYRVEFFENDTNTNGGGYGQLQTYIGTANITSAGTGSEEFTKTISGSGHTFIRATLTEIDGTSSDGFGMSSPTSELGLQADLQVVTSDGETEVFEGTTGHEITQTITNLGPTTVTDIDFNLSATTCYTLNTVTESGTATDTGTYTADPEYDWTGVLEPGQDLVLTFSGDASCSAGNDIVLTQSINSMEYNSETVTDPDTDNNDYMDTTSIVGYFAALTETTTDGLDEIEAGTTDHEITQTIYNGGPDVVDTIEFNITQTDCFTLNSIGADTGSYNEGTNTWTGTLNPSSTLILTFTGDISCDATSAMNFTHGYTSLSYAGVTVVDVDDDTNDFGDSTNVLTQQTELEIVTDDGTDSIFTGTTGHEITQTITNNGPNTVTDIDFNMDGLGCYTINSISESGTATDTGTYTGDPDYDWTGILESGQTLVLTFSGDESCGSGNTITINHYINGLENSGFTVNDSNNDNNDYTDNDTEIVDKVSDLSVAKTLNNPEDLAPGAELEYTITLTNNGPDNMDISYYTGSMPGQNQLFLDFMPPDITFTGWTSDDNIGCFGGVDNGFGPGSASMFGAALGTHSDYELVMCVNNKGSEDILANGESVSGVMTVAVSEDSDLNFTNYVYGAFGQNDPTQSYFASYDGSSDVIDYIDSIDGTFNNLAASAPVIDASIEKSLHGEGSTTPGATVSYDVTFTNKGPMSPDLAESNATPLFADLFPGDALSFASVSNEGYQCQDLGPGSIAYLGNAGVDHPNHQIVVCAYTDEESEVLGVGESVTLTLNFTVNESAPASYTNYAVISSIPTDPDVAYLSNIFYTTEDDVLDSIDNENFDKVTYTNVNAVDDDNDGVPNITEDNGPNGGDANNDGTPDSEQANVVNFTSGATGKPVALEVSDDCSITSSSTNSEVGNSETDPAYSYPLGFLGFTLDCGTPGYTATITAYFFNATDDGYTVRKYHSDTDTYTTIEGASISKQSIDTSQVVVTTYQVTDGQSLDSDGVEDGNITDPVGLGMQSTSDSGLLGSTGESVVTLSTISVILITLATGAIWARKNSTRSRYHY